MNRLERLHDAGVSIWLDMLSRDLLETDGFISFECTPDVADDAEATIAQALDLWHRLDPPNVAGSPASSSTC